MHRMIQRVCTASCCQSHDCALQYHRDGCEDVAWEEVDVVDLGADRANTPRSPVSVLAGLHSATAACLDNVSNAAELKRYHTSLLVWWVRACWGSLGESPGSCSLSLSMPLNVHSPLQQIQVLAQSLYFMWSKIFAFARTSSRQQRVELKLWHLTTSTCHKCSHSKRSCCMSEVQGVCAC